jgi:acetoin utilization deacetylase AcuC-like enzyme
VHAVEVLGLQRVSVIDIDLHHGNGSEVREEGREGGRGEEREGGREGGKEGRLPLPASHHHHRHEQYSTEIYEQILTLPPPSTLSLPLSLFSQEILMGSTPVDGVHSNNRFQYISIHADDEFPYSGAATGDRDFPHLVNLPLPRTFDSIDHHDRWAKVEEAIEAFRPELILISAGYDAHAMDPIRLHMAKDGGTGGLTARDFHALVSTIKAKADKHCMGRLVAVMEGGYGTTSCCGGGGRGGSGRAKGKGK